MNLYLEDDDGVMHLIEEHDDITPERRAFLLRRAEFMDRVAEEAARRHAAGEPGVYDLPLSRLAGMFGWTAPQRSGVVVHLPDRM